MNDSILKYGERGRGGGIEEETDRREGKGRRCCLGDGIHSIPCRTTDLTPEFFEIKD